MNQLWLGGAAAAQSCLPIISWSPLALGRVERRQVGSERSKGSEGATNQSTNWENFGQVGKARGGELFLHLRRGVKGEMLMSDGPWSPEHIYQEIVGYGKTWHRGEFMNIVYWYFCSEAPK